MRSEVRPEKYQKSIANQILYSCKNYEKWFYPSLLDLKSKYKNTKLGNFWNVITSIVIVSFISTIWSFVFKKDYIDFWIYYFCGYTIWTIINNVISQSTTLYFINYRSDILNYPAPVTIYNIRNVFSNIVIFMHFLPVFIIIFSLGENLNLFNIFLFFIGIIILSLNLFFLSIIISIICSRYRDLPMLINTIMASMFLVSPILWKKEEIGKFQDFIHLNPIAAYIDIIRDPILNGKLQLSALMASICMLLIFILIALIIIKIKGRRIVYWI